MSPRLITLTLNPALDIAAEADEVVPTHKIRMHQEHSDPGGGGVNVARVVHELGGDMLAVMAAGGASGRVLEEMLDEAGVKRRTVPIKGLTRVSLNVQDRTSGLEYRFVPEGPTLTEAEWQSVLAVLQEVEGDWLIASGSLPHGVPDDAYAQVARIANRRGQPFVLDTSGPALAGCGGPGRNRAGQTQPERTGVPYGAGPEGSGGPGGIRHGSGAARRRAAGGGHARP